MKIQKGAWGYESKQRKSIRDNHEHGKQKSKCMRRPEDARESRDSMRE